MTGKSHAIIGVTTGVFVLQFYAGSITPWQSVAGVVISLIASLLSIKVFLTFVENNNLTLFVVLRLILGAGLLFYSFS